MITAETVFNDIKKIRKRTPLVHNITNFVVMNSTANALLCIGASPVMAHAREEVEEMVAIASALVINIGTLSGPWVESMLAAGKAAVKNGVPVVLDPVGAGATTLRTETAGRLIQETKPSVIRGNSSEILSLAESEPGKTKGVDSIHASESALQTAKRLAAEAGSVVVVSGASDFITDGENTWRVDNGVDMMGKVTGLGCTATALIGAFAAVNKDYLAASAHAMAVMGIAGELASGKSTGPGSMQVHFLDALYTIGRSEIGEKLRCAAVDG